MGALTLTEYAERMWRSEARMRGLFADGAPMGVAAGAVLSVLRFIQVLRRFGLHVRFT